MTYTVPPGRYSDVNSAFVQAYIDAAISNVIDLAPETLNSLNELAAAINDDPAFYATIANQISELNTDVTDLVTALDINENDVNFGDFISTILPDDAKLKDVLEAFASAYETAKSNLESADSTLSGRIDALETDPTTAAAVQAVQDDVDQNELDSDAADLALSNRLDTLEADPTTQTIVDSVAGGLSGRLDTLEADPTTQTLLDAVETSLDSRIDTLELSDANRGGGVSSTAFQFKTDTTQGAAAGTLRFNNATPASVTEIYLSYTNKSGVDLQNVYPELLKSGVRIYIQTESDATKYLAADIDGAITDNGSDFTVSVTNLVVGNLPSNNDKVQFAVVGTTSITTALDGRLDVLEADPTTATAVAAVQSDVDQNEADADAAIALKLNTADPAATGKLTVDTEAALEFDSNLTKLHNELRGTRIDVGNNITVYPAAAGGRFEIEGGLYIRLTDLEEHNNDTDAANAGIVVGGVYYDGNGHLKIRRS